LRAIEILASLEKEFSAVIVQGVYEVVAEAAGW
jgi:hypothetical protein